ncbi:MAG: low molecular weight phosphatase family protein [Verrucomicrobia bacterium]|nr:low molecular weight phosphatase family protein [Verrucomicrobiota bacterium]
MTSLVLFVCTGNYYRSRFAEAVFNHYAELKRLNWKAVSRGLAIHWVEGYLSPFTIDALAVRKIELRHTGPARVQLTEHDLETAQRRIALDRDEHHSMMQIQFPQWADRIEYWSVADLGFQAVELALPEIESKVLSLIEELGA